MAVAQSFRNKDFIDSKSGISVHERWPIEPCPLHWHEYIELELVLDGNGLQRLNGREMPLSAGTLTVIRHTDFHEVVPIEKLHLINFSIDDRVLSEEILLGLSGGKELFFSLNATTTATLAGLMGLISTETEAENPDQRYLKHLVLCLFLKILGLVPKMEGRGVEISASLQSALLYMKLHFRENPSLSEVAAAAHYNPNHFSTAFHREMGKTFSAYLNELKLSYAKELLMTTDRKITEVCFESGFSTHSNFLRSFKAETGKTPAEFRKTEKTKG